MGNNGLSHPVPVQLLWILSLLLLIAGCAPTTVREPASDLPRAPRNLVEWKVSGKASIRTANGLDTFSFQWRRPALGSETLSLSGPLGLGATQLQRYGSTLYWVDGEDYKSLDQLDLDPSIKRTAAMLPVEHLGDWLLGYPAAPEDWQVTVESWQAIESLQLPRKLALSHPRYQIKLVLLDWELEDRP